MLFTENVTNNFEHLWEDFNIEISLEDTIKDIEELNIKKDPGPMNISPDFLKRNIDILAPVINNSINTILRTGRIPEKWKECCIAPIPKKGSKVDISNYRGIALQSVIPKILDKTITRMLYHHLGNHISKNQHGFIKERSTITNLMEITQFLHEAIGQKHQVDVIYFDFTKVFDQIQHDRLAIKLARLSMPYLLYRTIIKFVLNRKYIVRIDNQPTNFVISPKSSVPQGSHCGPVSFIIYINDFVIIFGNNILQYADDTKFYRIIRNYEDVRMLQKEIANLGKWSKINGLTLNTAKTKCISYGKKKFNTKYYIGS